MTGESAMGSSDGVFRFVPPLRSDARTGASNEARIDTRNVHDKATFLTACAAALDFPEYFGRNWDAFYDCLCDLALQSAGATGIIFDNLSAFARAEPEEFDAAIDSMIDAAEYWREHNSKLTVLVGLEQPVLAPHLPEISFR